MTSGSGSPQAANWWRLGEVFEEIWNTLYSLSIHIRSLIIINQSGLVLFTLLSLIVICTFSSLTDRKSWLPCLYCLVITFQISVHDLGFYSSFCCRNNHKYYKGKHPKYCAFLGRSFQTSSLQFSFPITGVRDRHHVEVHFMIQEWSFDHQISQIIKHLYSGDDA